MSSAWGTVMVSFQTVRDRDASASIRGYAYQIDLSIERWLALDENEVLELECGEDIDIVSRALQAPDDAERDRLLNQVKSRERRISLRRPEALESLASFAEHRLVNPDMQLRFLYTTNALPTCERPSIFEDNTPGIAVWNRLQRGDMPPAEATSALTRLREFLKLQPRPVRLSEATWERFQHFLQSADEEGLEVFVRGFAWDVGRTPPQGMGRRISEILVADGHAPSMRVAHEIHCRLQAHVLGLLCKPGPKRLDRVSFERHAALPEPSAPMRTSLELLHALYEGLEAKVDANTLAIAGLEESAVGAAKLEAELVYTSAVPIIQIPALVKHASGRRDVVARMADQLGDTTWVAIHGPSGTGKTQLAVLVATESDSCAAWVRLRSAARASSLALSQFERSLEAVTSCIPTPDRRAWYNHVASRLGAGSLVVIDDVPRLGTQATLAEALVLMCQACQRMQVGLLTTSPHPIPRSVMERLGQGVVDSVPVPLLQNEEAAEIFVAHGAPKEACTPETVSFVNDVCRQHPSLLVAAVLHLKDRDWQFSNQELRELLGGKHAASLGGETLKRILETVASPQSRALLDRLTLIVHQFGNDDVTVAAAVPPAIERPFDRLDPLLGLWVQYDVQATYLVSPLVKSLGPVNLPKEVALRTNLALGDAIIRKKRLDQSGALHAILYLSGAEAWDRAGHVLLTALFGMLKQGIPSYDAGLLAIWGGLPLPPQMSLGLRIYIRGLQLLLYSRRGRPLGFLVDDLSSLVDQASKQEDLPTFAASMNAVMALTNEEPGRACSFLKRAYELWPRICENPELTQRLAEFPLGSLIWTAAIGFQTAEQIDRWMEAAASMPAELRANAVSSEFADMGCIILADALWMREAEKPLPERRWPTVRSGLAKLAETASRLDMELLDVCATRARMIVLGEYEERSEEAIAIGKEAIASTSDPRGRFLLQDCIARQLLYQEDKDEAASWFANALAEPTGAYPLVRLQLLANASVAVGSKDHAKAVDYLNQAVELGRSSEDIPVTEFVKAAGELCVLEGLAGRLPASFCALDTGASHLLDDRTDSPRWKALFMVLGHVSGYFSTVACTGQPPESTANGEPYAAPVPGMFLRYDQTKCASLYEEGRACAILVQLAEFADGVGNLERAEHWAFKGIEAARSADLPVVVDLLSLQVVPLLILRGRYAEAIDLSVEAATITTAGQKKAKRKGLLLKPGLDVAAALGPKPGNEWNEAERNSISFGLFPVACHLATELLERSEEAAEHAREAVAACRQLSQTASHRDLWEKSAEVVERSFVAGMSSRPLSDLVGQLDDETYGWLRTVGYVGVTAQEDCPLPDVCRLQVAILRVAQSSLGRLSRISYRKILLPWVVSFWQKRFQSERFRFRAPSAVASRLEAAIEEDEDRRAQAILRAVAEGLGVRFGVEDKKWLHAPCPI